MTAVSFYTKLIKDLTIYSASLNTAVTQLQARLRQYDKGGALAIPSTLLIL